jgi:hypothetical protein
MISAGRYCATAMVTAWAAFTGPTPVTSTMMSTRSARRSRSSAHSNGVATGISSIQQA